MKTIDVLRKYFSKEQLTNFDGGVPYKCFDNDCYGAVGLDYLHKYLLKKRISKKFVAQKMFELCLDNTILPIPCAHAGGLVFCTTSYAQGRWFSKFSFNQKQVIMPQYYINDEDSMYSVTTNAFNSYLK
tara:strand:+ start:662 stop:1048 length:387 start_codon:yes stop_codon:yes gene_type:complete